MFERTLGFLQGVLVMGLVGAIVGVAFLEMETIGLYSTIIVVSALLTILLLKGIPINEINVGEKFSIDFEVDTGDE